MPSYKGAPLGRGAPQINGRLNTELMERLIELSKRTHRSLNVEATLALEEWLTSVCPTLDETLARDLHKTAKEHLAGPRTLSLRVTDDLRSRLKEAASDLKISMNSILTIAIEQHANAASSPRSLSMPAPEKEPVSLMLSDDLKRRIKKAHPGRSIPSVITDLLTVTYFRQKSMAQQMRELMEEAAEAKRSSDTIASMRIDQLWEQAISSMAQDADQQRLALDRLRTQIRITREAS